MKTNKELRKFQKRMKRRPTKTEAVFGRRLQSAHIQYKFQVIVGFYIPDFVIPSRMLIIELDGTSHDKTVEYDSRRDAFLKSCGFDVLRIKNEDMWSFDVENIKRYPYFTNKIFRSALARANSYKGQAMKGRKKNTSKRSRSSEEKPKGILDRYFHQRYLSTLS